MGDSEDTDTKQKVNNDETYKAKYLKYKKKYLDTKLKIEQQKANKKQTN